MFAATGGRPFDAAAAGGRCSSTAPAWTTRSGRLQTRYFAHHGRSVLAVDLPGHGRSDGTPLHAIADLASWIVRLLDAAAVQSAALVGHSMGALIALEAAAAATARVRSLALLGVAERMPVHPDLQSAADGNRRLAPELVASWGHGRSGHLGGNPAPGLWMMGGSLQLLERAPAGVLAADLAACNAYDGALAAAARDRLPDAVAAGRPRPHDSAGQSEAARRCDQAGAHRCPARRRPHARERAPGCGDRRAARGDLT